MAAPSKASITAGAIKAVQELMDDDQTTKVRSQIEQALDELGQAIEWLRLRLQNLGTQLEPAQRDHHPEPSTGVDLDELDEDKSSLRWAIDRYRENIQALGHQVLALQDRLEI